MRASQRSSRRNQRAGSMRSKQQGAKQDKKYFHVSIIKLADAFEAQFFSTVKVLDETKDKSSDK